MYQISPILVLLLSSVTKNKHWKTGERKEGNRGIRAERVKAHEGEREFREAA